ncbi:uncharacterized protein LOC134773600 [Penaeus indicus]|uniref:uncharacterized protein LOC134773600 n=1 Tax=Penaeus indicus TaxID=29960 RepID=UPI00300CE058
MTPPAPSPQETVALRWHPSSGTPPLAPLLWHPSSVIPPLAPLRWHPSSGTPPLSSLRWLLSAGTPPLASLLWHPSTVIPPLAPHLWHPSAGTPPLAPLRWLLSAGTPLLAPLRCHPSAGSSPLAPFLWHPSAVIPPLAPLRPFASCRWATARGTSIVSVSSWVPWSPEGASASPRRLPLPPCTRSLSKCRKHVHQAVRCHGYLDAAQQADVGRAQSPPGAEGACVKGVGIACSRITLDVFEKLLRNPLAPKAEGAVSERPSRSRRRSPPPAHQRSPDAAQTPRTPPPATRRRH